MYRRALDRFHFVLDRVEIVKIIYILLLVLPYRNCHLERVHYRLGKKAKKKGRRRGKRRKDLV